MLIFSTVDMGDNLTVGTIRTSVAQDALIAMGWSPCFRYPPGGLSH
jgi:hypothetical protein